jgi:hypothetical protein
LSSDAVSCYDPIVHSVAASLRARTIVCMFDTLQEMTHYIRTVHGESEIYFKSKGSEKEPIQGVGQGNGTGPTICAVVSPPVLDMLRD